MDGSKKLKRARIQQVKGEKEMKTVSGGFTLIELMITVVVVAILATVAYPGYQNYMRQTRRSDAQIALVNVANLQERFFTQCNRYATSLTAARNCTDLGLNVSAVSLDGYYQLAIVNASATAFTVSAGPVATGPQAGDAECTGFTINERGTRAATGSNTSRCWRR